MRETLGEYVRGLRISEGMTLTKVAAALDLDQSTLSKIETNKRRFAPETLKKIAKVFSLDLRQLEIEYYSEQIASILCLKDNDADILEMAREKTRYFRTKQFTQGNIKF